MSCKVYEMCDYDLSFKIIITGDSQVGKSTFIKLYSIGETLFVTPTIGVDFSTTGININNNNFRLQIWDTAGQERFRSIISRFYKNTHGCIVMFDLTNYKSFESLDYWIEQINENAKKTVSIIIVGNKCKSNDIVVSKDEINAYVNQKNLKYIEIDNNKEYNIDEPFKTITNQIYEVWKTENEHLETPEWGCYNKTITTIKTTNDSKKCCIIS
tara:strand:- start:986 stop:1624 length:639 start_codon:yes stop_codon:yes gene_type:complete